MTDIIEVDHFDLEEEPEEIIEEVRPLGTLVVLAMHFESLRT